MTIARRRVGGPRFRARCWPSSPFSLPPNLDQKTSLSVPPLAPIPAAPTAHAQRQRHHFAARRPLALILLDARAWNDDDDEVGRTVGDGWGSGCAARHMFTPRAASPLSFLCLRFPTSLSSLHLALLLAGLRRAGGPPSLETDRHCFFPPSLFGELKPSFWQAPPQKTFLHAFAPHSFFSFIPFLLRSSPLPFLFTLA